MRFFNWHGCGRALLLSAVSVALLAGTAAAQGGMLVDSRDGARYKTVTIGSHTWMAENMRYTPTKEASDIYKHYLAFEHRESLEAKHGKMYDLKTARRICPEGWHLPSVAEWSDLFDATGAAKKDKKQAKDCSWKGEEAKKLWSTNNQGTNTLGFSAISNCILQESGESEGKVGDSKRIYSWIPEFSCGQRKYPSSSWWTAEEESGKYPPYGTTAAASIGGMAFSSGIQKIENLIPVRCVQD